MSISNYGKSHSCLTPVDCDSSESIRPTYMTSNDGFLLIQSNARDTEGGYCNHVCELEEDNSFLSASDSTVNRTADSFSSSYVIPEISDNSLPPGDWTSFNQGNSEFNRGDSQSSKTGFNFMRLFGISIDTKKPRNSRSRRYSASSVEGSSTLDDIQSMSNSQHEDIEEKNNEIFHSRNSFIRQQSTPLGHLQGNKEYTLSLSNKLHSIWNTMKFGWNMKTGLHLSTNEPIYLLSKSYFKRAKDIGLSRNSSCDTLLAFSSDSFESFLRDYASRTCFTYRRGFQPIPVKVRTSPLQSRRQNGVEVSEIRSVSTTQTSDCGWGCMVRCGQMLLAQTFTMHFLGRNWSIYDIPSVESKSDEMHRRIIRWFADSPDYPFSIHRLVELSGKSPGDRFGPATLCRLIQHSMKLAADVEPRLSEIAVYVVEDNVIYRDELYQLIGANTDRRSTLNSFDANMSISIEQGVEALTVSSVNRSILILLPLYLGGANGINDKVYCPVVQSILRDSACVGGLGGSPGHSVFLIGYQGNRLVHIDPHYCQKTVDVNLPDFPLESYHCLFPKTMQLKKLDPSCAFGFYCHSRVELDDWLSRAATRLTANSAYPLIEVVSGGRKGSVSRSFSLDSDSTTVAVRSRSRGARPQSNTNDFQFL